MTFDTGEHPSAMVLSRDGNRLFVASANSGVVNVFSTFSGDPLEDIVTSPFTEAPLPTTPNALALAPDGNTLLVALADMNAVAVVDVSNIAQSLVDGFIPTAWYPTGVAYTRDGKQILVLSGKGMTPAANPQTGGLDKRLKGTVSILPQPDRVSLADLTRRTLSLTPYSEAIRLTPANIPVGSPIPRSVGASSPIKHVFYIIKENRTYDQILGDAPHGNGDPTLALFGNDVTPNAHSLAQNFVLFDNFYVDADVSYDGHAFSTAAYATDVVQKLWQTLYANRGGQYLGEGSFLPRNQFGNLAAPERGYIWDYAARAKVTVRSYGEFAYNASKTPAGGVAAAAGVPGLQGLVAPTYAAFDLDITDSSRVDNWLSEFRDYESNGNLPQLSVIHLPNDHTKGSFPGARTPRAMVADNDLALGRIVEAVSNSAYWRDSAIFVLEDDAQSGPDHVDSHRSLLFVASPFAKRNFVGRAPHNRARHRPRAHEPVRRGRNAALQCLCPYAESGRLPAPDAARLDGRAKPAVVVRRDGIAGDGFHRGGPHARSIAQRHHLAVREGRQLADAAATAKCLHAVEGQRRGRRRTLNHLDSLFGN